MGMEYTMHTKVLVCKEHVKQCFKNYFKYISQISDDFN